MTAVGPCPICDGDCQVVVVRDGETITIDCPVCDGSGLDDPQIAEQREFMEQSDCLDRKPGGCIRPASIPSCTGCPRDDLLTRCAERLLTVLVESDIAAGHYDSFLHGMMRGAPDGFPHKDSRPDMPDNWPGRRSPRKRTWTPDNMARLVAPALEVLFIDDMAQLDLALELSRACKPPAATKLLDAIEAELDRLDSEDPLDDDWADAWEDMILQTTPESRARALMPPTFSAGRNGAKP